MNFSGNALVLGKFVGHFGVKGWLKVVSYTRPVDEIFQYSTLWVKAHLATGGWREVSFEQTRSQEKRLAAKINGINNREQAEAFINCEIAVAESELVFLPEGEYYWRQLIGLRMRNLEDVDFGVVDHILETGANDVLVVKDCENKLERLVPWTKDVVSEVDLQKLTIVVDWDSDF